jgi:hypothetical protein
MSIVIKDLAVADGRLSFGVEGGPSDHLWYEVEPEYQSWFATDRYDAAVLAILPYAMITGKPIRVLGGVTDLLLDDLRTGIIPILNRQRPDLFRIEIDAVPVAAETRGPGSGVLMGLSCGVDSLCTLLTHLDHPVAGRRITHFSFHDVGAHGKVNPDEVFAWRSSHARAAAAAAGRPLIVVRSNLASFRVASFRQYHTLLNCAVGIALGAGVGTFLYSASHPYEAIQVARGGDISYADPILLPLFSSSGVSCVSADAHMTRVEKTALIADWPYAQRWLDVCVNASADNRNCGACKKCCRTALTLELLGKLEAFRDRFDLDRYRSARAKFISYMLLHSEDSLVSDVLDLARTKGVRLASPSMRIKAFGQRWIERSRVALRRRLRARQRRRAMARSAR